MQLIWDEFLKIIKEEAGSQVVETWFKAVCLDEWDCATNTATVRAPNQFVNRWLQDHYVELLKTHLARLLNAHGLKLNFTCSEITPAQARPRTIMPASVLNSMHSTQPPSRPHTPPFRMPHSTAIIPSKTEHVVQVGKKNKEHRGNTINPQYLFDSFIVGPNNSLAHAAAYAICQNMGKAYNPLYIYGGTGLGKTHLLHAIANQVRAYDPSLIVQYETSDNFINEFINSIRFDRSPQFRSRYQKADVLLLDDIQFLSNKEQTQETFFHIFNVLYEQQKQIVLSSDTFPKEIKGLQSRLKSRMEWGLVADIQIPDLETKIAILKKKAEAHATALPDEVADFIATRVISNIRELEGALIRVNAFSVLTNQLISLELARKVLLNLHEAKREGVMLDNIVRGVAKHYAISINDIRSKKRHHDISVVRQVAFYMMKKLSYCSLQVIGSYIGGRDHSTVIHAIGKVEALIKQDPSFAQKLKTIEHDIMVA